MNEMMTSPMSLIHVSSALLALISGTWIVWKPKGGRRHRLVGYGYAACMVVVLTTAFGIYRLFGRFGLVHWGAVASWFALALGLVPVWIRKRLTNWRKWHYFGMVVSITGLYATFVVESTYRLFPARYFWWSTVGTATVVFVFGRWLAYGRTSRQSNRRNRASRTLSRTLMTMQVTMGK